jgi:hypothetical protein
VHASLDDLVIALYVTIDELLEPRRGPGRRPRLSDAELVCLAVAQVLLGYDSERRWLRAVNGRLGHLFPYVCGQAAYNRRLRRAAPLVATILHTVAVACPSWADQWRLLDATPVPCGQSRQTRKRSALAGWAGYGYDRSHSRWYWGLKLYVLASPDGLPVAWCLANPTHGEREVAEGLLDHAARQRILRPGMVILGDKGFAGRAFEQLGRRGYLAAVRGGGTLAVPSGARLRARRLDPGAWCPDVQKQERSRWGSSADADGEVLEPRRVLDCDLDLVLDQSRTPSPPACETRHPKYQIISGTDH